MEIINILLKVHILNLSFTETLFLPAFNYFLSKTENFVSFDLNANILGTPRFVQTHALIFNALFRYIL